MAVREIAKPLRPGTPPRLPDYAAGCRAFSWPEAWRSLTGETAPRSVNLGRLALDRNVARGLGDKTALRWLAVDGSHRDVTYSGLMSDSRRFAGALSRLGIGKGDSVFCLLGRVPELYAAAHGTWRHGSVFCPLFSAFGPEPIKARVTIAQPRVLVTSERLYRRKVAPVRAELTSLEHVVIVDGHADGLEWSALLAAEDGSFDGMETSPDDISTYHFTSGTTGTPKGAVHVHGGAVAHYATARYALDLGEDDVFWCTADPGWVTGTSYGIIAPQLIGCTMLADEQDFDAERWYRTLQDERVTVWYTAPTALRMLMKAGAGIARRYDLSSLRLMASVGEPLNPEVVTWAVEALGLPVHDNWWQTETGGIMVSNFASMPIRPGSMGKPIPGIEAGIVQRTVDGVEEITQPGVQGELALRPGWPSMFRGYLHEEERYRKCFAGGWYLSGDLASRDADGYFWFVGRADDVIKSAGHLIGPFEVESVLLEHPAVAEAGVIGVPDPVAMEVVKAFVSLKPGQAPSEELRSALMAHCRKRLGPAVAPRLIDFRDSLPRTRSGKIMRRLLKARELGLPEGDLSTLEGTQ